MEARIGELLEPIAAELGIDVLAVQLHGRGRYHLLRVIVDRTGGVDSDMLERISRALSLQLDAEDPIVGRYQLEVTSPGLDWPLATMKDFSRHRGEMLHIRLQDGSEIAGENLGPAGDGIDVRERDGMCRHVSLAEIAKAVRVIDWQAASKRTREG